MAVYEPETPGSEVEFDQPNIPACWSTQPVSGGTGGGSGTQNVNVVNTSPIEVSVSGTPAVSVNGTPNVNIANTPTVTVGNAEANPVPTKEVAAAE